MNNLFCPKCGQPLRIFIRKLDEERILIRAECTNCGYYTEIIAKKRETAIKSDLNESLEIPELTEIDLSNVPSAVQLIVEEARRSPAYKIVYFDHLYREPPDFGIEVSTENFVLFGFDKEFSEKLVQALRSRGITCLYRYQEEAIKKVISGENIVIVAQTAMGKTEAFLIPALYMAYKEKIRPTVIIIYPTKALARDQLFKIRYYGEALGIKVEALDGDTPWSKRRKIMRDPPHILLTNFDMIHYWLPRLKKTRSMNIPELFLNAKMLIIDEVHEYYGAFGTHVHYILKRLSRLCRHDIQIIMASATIQNPLEFAELLSGRTMNVVKGKGRRVSLYVIFIYTLDSPFRAIAKFLSLLAKNQIKTLAFLNTRSSAELALNAIKRTYDRFLRERIELHRAGIPAKLREKIEMNFKIGKLLGIISTPTLELGVDIGDVQAVISELVPIDRFIQRGGRAGRREESGVAVLLLRAEDPISEYYARHPEEYFNDVSARYLEPKNSLIAKRHIYLMAYERKLSLEEAQLLPKNVVEELVKEGALISVSDGWVANGFMFHKFFSRNIRGIEEQIDIVFNSRIIDRREILVGIKELYPGAIYLNRGIKYIVRDLDLKNKKAVVEKASSEYEFYYTKPLYGYNAVPMGDLQARDVLGTKIFYGPLKMTISVFGYAVFREGEKKPIALEYLDKPIEYEYPTFGLFFKAPPYTKGTEEDIGGAYHATEHILIEGTYRISGGSEFDLGGISYGTSGIIVIHEALPGGNGVAKLLFDRFDEAVKKAHQILDSPICRAKEEMNKCVFSYHCGNNNRPLNQRGAREILERMLQQERVVDADKAPEILRSFEKGIV